MKVATRELTAISWKELRFGAIVMTAFCLRGRYVLAALLASSYANAADAPTPLQYSDEIVRALATYPEPNYLMRSGQTSDGASVLHEFFERWADITEEARASQPDWLKPIATSTARLGQEVRYDQYFEHQANGADLVVYDGSKGLSLIVAPESQVMLYLPPYEQRSNVKPTNGWGDWPALTIKRRLLSANKEDGDYIVSVLFGFQAPTGDRAFTNDVWVLTPTLALGKGWGAFDIQATIGVAAPLEHRSTIGTSIANSVAFQYHAGQYFWPRSKSTIRIGWTVIGQGKTKFF